MDPPHDSSSRFVLDQGAVVIEAGPNRSIRARWGLARDYARRFMAHASSRAAMPAASTAPAMMYVLSPDSGNVSLPAFFLGLEVVVVVVAVVVV